MKSFGLLFLLFTPGLMASSPGIFGNRGGKRAPGLRIRFTTTIDFGWGTTYFIDIPRTLPEAERAGWRQEEREESPYLPALTLFCPKNDHIFCALYDDSKYIAGIQLALDPDHFSKSNIDLTTVGFRRWTPPALSGEKQKTYLINHQFFVNEDVLALPAPNRSALHPNGEVLYNRGLWLPDIDGHSLRFIPSRQSDILKTEYTKQACIPWMGTHFWPNQTKTADCTSKSVLYPWFLITAGDELVATGLGIFGKMTLPARGKRMWYEIVGRPILEAFIPNGAECFYALGDNPGALSMHIYYIDNPATVLCLD